MLPPIDKIKGIPPGTILERELTLRNIRKADLANSIAELPQLISYICKGSRAITPKLSLKLDAYFGAEEGYFLILQAYYLIEQEKKSETLHDHPDLSKINPAIFWDTRFDQLNWRQHQKMIIQRIFERGGEMEINEIIRFYGREEVTNIIQNAHTLLYTAIDNAEHYLGIDKNTIACYNASVLNQPQPPYFNASGK